MSPAEIASALAAVGGSPFVFFAGAVVFIGFPIFVVVNAVLDEVLRD